MVANESIQRDVKLLETVQLFEHKKAMDTHRQCFTDDKRTFYEVYHVFMTSYYHNNIP